MNCSTLLRLLILFTTLLITNTLSNPTTHQHRLPPPSTLTRIATLKTTISQRLETHQNIITTHLTGILTTLTRIDTGISTSLNDNDALSSFISGFLTTKELPHSETELRGALHKLAKDFTRVKRGSTEILGLVGVVMRHLEKVEAEMKEMEGFLMGVRGEMRDIRGEMGGKMGKFANKEFTVDTVLAKIPKFPTMKKSSK